MMTLNEENEVFPIQDGSESTEQRIENLRLRPEEIEMFQYLLEQKFMTADQLVQRFYPNYRLDERGRSHGYFRLNKLKRVGYLDFDKGSPGVIKTLYYLKFEGLKVLRENGYTRDLRLVTNPDFEFVNHDLAVTNCRLLFESIGFSEQWFSERVLLSIAPKPRQLPDAVFRPKARLKGRTIALEVEFTLKSKARYQEIASFYSRSKLFDFVFYIGGNEKLIETIMPHFNDIKFFFCPHKELLEKTVHATFRSQTEKFQLGEMVPRIEKGERSG